MSQTEKKVIKETKEKVANFWSQLIDEEKELLKKREELYGPPVTKPKTFNEEQAALKKHREEMFTEEYQIKQEKIRKINHEIDILHKKRGVLDMINIEGRPIGVPPHHQPPTPRHGQIYVDWVMRRLNTVDAHNKYKPSHKKVSIPRTPVSTSSTPEDFQSQRAEAESNARSRAEREPKATFGIVKTRRATPKTQQQTTGGKNKRKISKKTNKHKSRKHKNTRKTKSRK